MATALDVDAGRVQVVSSSESTSFFGRVFAGRRESSILRNEREYSSALCEAASEDFSDLDQLGFLSVPGGRDKEGRQVVLVAAKHYPARMLKTDRVFRYLIHKLDAVVDEPYVVVWLHTASSYWTNCPSLAWLWRTYERLPCKYRSNLARLYVVHCDLPLWGALAALGPLLSADFWRKIEWVSRVEFLWDHIPKKQLLPALPAYVAEHDALLEDQPLMDYGVVASKEVNNVPGLPAPPM
ncbi:hypothetical protein HXX76_003164 [Chlamydomonas incerta]|uniref:CRAL-TRIO domain-containing protein n=1 Tax=Chlamydomonas incerta TaxID=51695 RepID=A0A835TDX5_CHLIN|nr:hypothetical protein HXX76_003164 [Chlamydomonas incerta]|eukprot:KAG2441543.1 hypothetical protein HXX76_003164 [Chlamydomonas incerta]